MYWITHPHPTSEEVQRHGLQTPAAFTRDAFREVVVEAHAACGVNIEEAGTFQEPHANGLPHMNCLVRSLSQYKWKRVAEKLREDHNIYVNFAPHIKTWAEGVPALWLNHHPW